ncbi:MULTISPECIES: SemiSWEET family sugar transporter [Aestuariimicrobium]|uniref:SemiSWEET family sugar transporter n=1 Tax=Aestuariimicrobium TaxID=396388 RepID=UPI0003B75068|nr:MULTISPECIES: PQ-loop domain-containing transporter [Aestuariimicrobium]CAI9411458.1 hypothetical protein AESSP_02655 [Aestuariimicrobium sp. T2.26MG-19.2B]
MSAFEIYGWTIALISSVSAVPQLLRILRSRTSAGASLVMWQITAAITGTWLVHGSLTGAYNLVLANGIACLMSVLILWFVRRDRTLSLLRTFGVPALGIAALVATDLWNPLVFGAFISIPQFIGGVAQFLDLLRCRDIRGVSVGFLAWQVAVQVFWFVWGLWGGDVAIQIAAGSFFVICLLNFIWWLLRRFGLVRAHGPQPEDGLVDAAVRTPAAEAS